MFAAAANNPGSADTGIGYAIDISQLADTEQAFKESEAKFRAIAEAMPQMVWSTRPDGYHDYYNTRWYEFTGVKTGSTDGEGWNNLFHPDDRERAWKRWQHSLETGDIYEIEYRLRHHSGAYLWVLGRALPIRDNSGAVVRWMGTCTDINDFKLAQERLRLSDQRKDHFLAVLSHELRNPLAPIISAAELITKGNVPLHKVKEVGSIILRQGDHMSSLIEELQDISRVSAGRVELNWQTMDLRQALYRALEQIRPLIERKQHLVSIHIEKQELPVYADERRLVQVFGNVLKNAAKYTSSGGRIDIKAMRVDDMVEVEIQDNGIGMSEEFLEHAFDLFAQSSDAASHSEGGLGIGLALVRSLVELHGGCITASSPGRSLGSKFVVTIPIQRVVE
ncbi:PAS domain-containing sensor histidine kinase [Noviherbaspirillum sp. CPCC 100848]|uniref:histidine kinase n=1 Tax=Noviherbaspirillum album TaxID=3080276 RepID=A0ABU6JH31_9BURK|nr:PAS domain-containing sensor histidine kinase [Noviherbaspirillum sp. CPCC 100848]MEC4722848.1 PAS domain-containing sensor histidine kinase [Noviherbaspirillum sp. CPCC 100848]